MWHHKKAGEIVECRGWEILLFCLVLETAKTRTSYFIYNKRINCIRILKRGECEVKPKDIFRVTEGTPIPRIKKTRMKAYTPN